MNNFGQQLSAIDRYTKAYAIEPEIRVDFEEGYLSLSRIYNLPPIEELNHEFPVAKVPSQEAVIEHIDYILNVFKFSKTTDYNNLRYGIDKFGSVRHYVVGHLESGY